MLGWSEGLSTGTLMALVVATSLACDDAGERRLTVPSYDNYTRQLVQLTADQNGDGRIDQWAFFDGNRPLRGEADADADGRIDRWEYFDERSALTRVGTSSMNDGIEDTWTWVSAVAGESRVDHSRRRDRQIDRREYFRDGVMVRAEEDTNADGRPDRWDRYEGTVLRLAEFDTTFSSGRANRRLVYDASGRFLRVEADPELDGSFVVVTGAGPSDVKSGGKR
ncbi:MAG: hypothetical protein WC815_13905 [Vicinamibacterales bacterium]|jgi:hypothetical protein